MSLNFASRRGLLRSTYAVLGAQRTMLGCGMHGANWGAAGNTYYAPIGGTMGAYSTDRTAAETAWGGAGTLSKMRIKPAANSRVDSSTVALYVNGVAVISFTVTAGSLTAQSDLVTQVPILPTDLVCIGVTLGAGAGTINFTPFTLEWATVGQIFTHQSYNNGTSRTAQAYASVGGIELLSLTESAVAVVALTPMRVSHFRMGVTAFGGTNTTPTSRKNSAIGSQSVLINGTGMFYDAVNYDDIALGESFGINRPLVAAAVLPMTGGFKMACTTAGVSQILSRGGSALTSGNTYYGGPFGSATWGVSEAASLAPVPFDCKLSLFSVRFSANASATGITFEIRKNGAAVRTFTVPAGSTSLVTDSNTAEIDYALGDTVSWKITGQSTTVTIAAVSFLLRDPLA